MTPSINLIVPLRDPGNALPKFVTCLDSQLLSTDEWAVTFVDGGSTDLTPGRLASLSRYRPRTDQGGAAAAAVDGDGADRARLHRRSVG